MGADLSKLASGPIDVHAHVLAPKIFETTKQLRSPVGRHALASIKPAILLGRPVSLIAPGLKVGICTV